MAETETLAAPGAVSHQEATTRPEGQPETKPEGASKQEKPIKRQMVGFTFFKVMPEWRRLPHVERAEHKRRFAEVLARWNQPGRLLSLTYSTVGLRPDCDMALWRICYSVDDLSEMMAELMATPLGGYLETREQLHRHDQALAVPHRPRARRPARLTGRHPPRRPEVHLHLSLLENARLVSAACAERQRLMTEHIRIGHLYPRVKLNTTYSFGIDDQEFVVAFESNFPEDFLDLVQQLRETEISAYTLKDTPIYTCIRMTPEAMLDRLG